MMRIDRENLKIANKIMHIRPSFDKQKLEKDFKAHQQMTARIEKLKKKRISVQKIRPG